jgi:hypothetical protein
MKKLLFILFTSSALFSNSQTLSLSEMVEKTNCQTFACFSDYVIKRGFSFSNLDTKNAKCCGLTIYTFKSDDYFDSVGGYVYKTNCSFSLIDSQNNKASAVIFSTKNKSNYIDILGELKSLDFIVAYEESANGEGSGVSTNYKSSKYNHIDIRITLLPKKDEKGQSYLQYKVMVMNSFDMPNN